MRRRTIHGLIATVLLVAGLTVARSRAADPADRTVVHVNNEGKPVIEVDGQRIDVETVDGKTRVTIDGKTTVLDGQAGPVTISSRDGKVLVNGREVAAGLSKRVDLHVTGSVADVTADGPVTCGAVGGNVTGNGSVTTGPVAGNVTAEGSLTVTGSVGGSLKSSGNATVGR